jgi:hypothetical protein
MRPWGKSAADAALPASESNVHAITPKDFIPKKWNADCLDIFIRRIPVFGLGAPTHTIRRRVHFSSRHRPSASHRGVTSNDWKMCGPEFPIIGNPDCASVEICDAENWGVIGESR